MSFYDWDPQTERKIKLIRDLVYPSKARGAPPIPCGLTFAFPDLLPGGPGRTKPGFRLEFTNGTVIEADFDNLNVSNPRIE